MNFQELKEQKLYWEDLVIGQVFDTPSRTITEADIVNFACLSADFNRLHVDATYASQTPFGQRIASRCERALLASWWSCCCSLVGRLSETF